jgi:hypothetical protein
MYVYVTQLYSGETKPFQGDEEYLKRALLAEYPFLYRYTNQHMPLTSILRELNDAQAYRVETDAADQLQKTMGGIEQAIGHETNQNAEQMYDHAALMALHPPIHQQKVDDFEDNVNRSTEPVAPVKVTGPSPDKGRATGIEGKAFYNHAGGRTLVKGGAYDWQDHKIPGGFNEIVSQAAYHAGGIGHLHQAVHATFTEGDHRFPAIAIHMEPDGYGLQKGLVEEELGKLGSSIRANARSNHRDEYSKMAMMDHLLGNFDRHEGNFHIKPNGQPIAIDNGGAFRSTGVLDTEHTIRAYNKAAPGCLDFSKEAIDWFHANKAAIGKSVTTNLALINDTALRSQMSNTFLKNYRDLSARLEARTKHLAFSASPEYLGPTR